MFETAVSVTCRPLSCAALGLLLAIGILTIGFSRAASADPITIDFSGRIDGSDTIQVYPDRAIWTHRYRLWPGTISFNGIEWVPNSLPHTLIPGGEPLIPTDLTRYSVRVDKTSGHDVAVAEVRDDHLLIYLNDNPNGASQYDFQVVLTEKPEPTRSPFAELHIQGGIDGSDRLVLTGSEANWVHRYWGTPQSILMNQIAWNPSAQSTLPNSGDTQFLPNGIDLTTARLTKNAGRDTATLEIFDDRTEIVFADNPNGGDFYDVTITFGSIPEPSSAMLAVLGFVSLLAYAWGRRRWRR